MSEDLDLEHNINSKTVVEAALFTAGRAISLGEISQNTGLSKRNVKLYAQELVKDYEEKDSGIEILEFEDKYVMQVRACLADKVSKLAPKEMEAPLLRTLAMIAYNQPITQSEVARIRGNKSYGHVKELEEKGLIRAEKSGRTKMLTTTKIFADYFGLELGNPEFVKSMMTEKKALGVTPMYESLAKRMGLDFVVVNPYKPYRNDLETLKQIDLLVMAPGYQDRVKELYSGKIIEAPVRTFYRLKESIQMILEATGMPNQNEIRSLLEEIDRLTEGYRERAKDAKAVKPLTPMTEEIAQDMGITISEQGVSVALNSAGIKAQILIPAHQSYDLDIIDRIKERYEAFLNQLMLDN